MKILIATQKSFQYDGRSTGRATLEILLFEIKSFDVSNIFEYLNLRIDY